MHIVQLIGQVYAFNPILFTLTIYIYVLLFCFSTALSVRLIYFDSFFIINIFN